MNLYSKENVFTPIHNPLRYRFLGGYQFDSYRQMRFPMPDSKTNTGINWEQYRPAINLPWMHYLRNKVIARLELGICLVMHTQ
jgi:hypothetical protein